MLPGKKVSIKKVAIVSLLIMLLVSMSSPALSENPAARGNENRGSQQGDVKQTPHASVNQTMNQTMNQNTTIERGKGNEAGPVVEKIKDLRLDNAKKQTMTGIDDMVRQLLAYRNRVDSSRLSEENKALMIQRINTNISWLSQKKSEVNASDDIQQVRLTAKEVDLRWKPIGVELKREAGNLACDEIESRINEARNASNIAAAKIKEMKEQGKDTAIMERKLASFNSNIEAASAHLKDAREEFGRINAPAGSNLRYGAGLSNLKKAENKLFQAYSDLKDLYRAYLFAQRRQ